MEICARWDKRLLPVWRSRATAGRMTLLFDLPASPSVPVVGEATCFPVRRIFCVGRNYAAHAREMGAEPDRETPFYFTKSPWAICASIG